MQQVLLLLLERRLALAFLELGEVLLLLLSKILLEPELVSGAVPCPRGGRCLLGDFAQGLVSPWGILVAVEGVVPYAATCAAKLLWAVLVKVIQRPAQGTLKVVHCSGAFLALCSLGGL